MTDVDRLLRAAIALSGLLALFLGLALRGTGVDHAWHPRAAYAIDTLAIADEALRRELFSARVGLSRHYDDINRAMTAGETALAELATLSTVDPDLEAATEALAGRTRALNAAAERFKTDNALLQNSLARFASLAQESPLADSAGRLPASVLRLTLDTSPDAIRTAREELARLDAAALVQDVGVSRTVAAQTRLLIALLPDVDALLRSLREDGIEPGMQRVREAIAERDRANRARHTTLSGLLAGAALVFASSVGVLVLRGTERNRRLRRQSANDHLSAVVAGFLLASDGEDADGRVARALERVAEHAGSARAFLSLSEEPPRVIAWPAVTDDEARRLGRIVTGARAATGWDNDLIALPAPPDVGPDLLLLRDGEAGWAVLGIEANASIPARRPELVAGLRMAMAAIVQAVRREEEAVARLALERRLAEAERLEAVGAIASGVAHNFNNIVGAIAGFGEMARGRVRPGSSVAGHLDEIGHAVTRARTLVDDILGFAGRRSAPGEEIRLAALLEETASLLRASFPPETAVVVRADGPDEVVGSPARLQQVFMNLCNNARAAALEGATITLTLSRRVLDRAGQLSHGPIAAGDYVVVAVDDNGPGVPTSILPRLFEPFFTTRPCGTGLGLSTAWQIVRDHGGTINVVLPSSGGSSFEVWLPRAHPRSGARTRWLGSGERVLLLTAEDRAADDETLLASLGCEPVYLSYADAPGALRTALANVDAVLAIDPPASAWGYLPQRTESFAPLIVAVGKGDCPSMAAACLRLPLQEGALAAALGALLSKRSP